VETRRRFLASGLRDSTLIAPAPTRPGFLAGPCARPRLHGAYPSLTDLVDGDLKMTVDFPRVYATVLESWLDLASKEALGGAFDPLPLLDG
jgi:hypothetical protein